MFGKMLSAALVTSIAAAPATMAADVILRDNSYVIALGKVDAANPVEVAKVRHAFTRAARQACMITGSRVANQRCVEQFVADAIAAVKRSDLQVALLNGASCRWRVGGIL